MKIAVIPLAILLVFTSAGVVAAGLPPNSAAAAACQADVDKFCPGVQPGGRRIATCLRQNKAQLSQPCKDAVAKARAAKVPAATAVPKG